MRTSGGHGKERAHDGTARSPTARSSEHSPVRHAVVLRRIDPELRMARFYTLMVERDLFGAVRLVRAWGRIGTRGDELVQAFATGVMPLRVCAGASTPSRASAPEYLNLS